MDVFTGRNEAQKTSIAETVNSIQDINHMFGKKMEFIFQNNNYYIEV